jgi:hypothetical protein
MLVNCIATPRSQARAPPHDQCHHRADGTRDACGIGRQILQRLIAADLCIPCETFEQGFRQFAGNTELCDNFGEQAICGTVHRQALIRPVEPVP